MILNSNPLPDLDPEDAEVRKEISVALISNKVSYRGKEPNSFPKVLEQERFKHSSSLSCLKRNIVLIQRMIEKNRTNQQFNWRPFSGPPMVKEMCLAEEIILKSVQFWNFNEEIQVLQNLSGEDRMFQNRQNAHTRNKKLRLAATPKVHDLSKAPQTSASPKDGKPPGRTYYSRRTFHIFWYGRIWSLVH